MDRTKFVAAACAVIAVAVAALFLTRARPKEAQPVSETEVEQANDALREFTEAYSRIAVVPLKSLGHDELQLMLGTVLDGGTLSVAERDSLRTAVADFLLHRYINDDPAEYQRWRESTGFRFIDRDAFVKDWDMTRLYPLAAGQPMPEGLPMNQLFAPFWVAGTSHFGKGDVPRKLAAEPAGWDIAFGPIDLEHPTSRPRLDGPAAKLPWYGSGSATMRNWFEPQVRPQGREARCAEVACVFEYANGDRRPLVMTFRWDAPLKRWMLFAVCQYNVPLDGRVAALEF